MVAAQIANAGVCSEERVLIALAQPARASAKESIAVSGSDRVACLKAKKRIIDTGVYRRSGEISKERIAEAGKRLASRIAADEQVGVEYRHHSIWANIESVGAQARCHRTGTDQVKAPRQLRRRVLNVVRASRRRRPRVGHSRVGCQNVLIGRDASELLRIRSGSGICRVCCICRVRCGIGGCGNEASLSIRRARYLLSRT